MTRMRRALPMFVHPAVDPAAWQAIPALDPSFVVVNVHNGPGSPGDPYYGPVLDALHRHGVPMVGYVDVDYGRRPSPAVADDVRAWFRRYPVCGVMFDQVPESDAAVCAAYVQSAGGGLLVGNPGVVPEPDVARLFDVVCTFEGSAADYRNFDAGDSAEQTADRVWHLVHGCPPGDVDAVYSDVENNGAGHAWVTTACMPSPWTGPDAGARRSPPV